jgi:hypothetical protein
VRSWTLEVGRREKRSKKGSWSFVTGKVVGIYKSSLF